MKISQITAMTILAASAAVASPIPANQAGDKAIARSATAVAARNSSKGALTGAVRSAGKSRKGIKARGDSDSSSDDTPSDGSDSESSDSDGDNNLRMCDALAEVKASQNAVTEAKPAQKARRSVKARDPGDSESSDSSDSSESSESSDSESSDSESSESSDSESSESSDSSDSDCDPVDDLCKPITATKVVSCPEICRSLRAFCNDDDENINTMDDHGDDSNSENSNISDSDSDSDSRHRRLVALRKIRRSRHARRRIKARDNSNSK